MSEKFDARSDLAIFINNNQYAMIDGLELAVKKEQQKQVLHRKLSQFFFGYYGVGTVNRDAFDGIATHIGTMLENDSDIPEGQVPDVVTLLDLIGEALRFYAENSPALTESVEARDKFLLLLDAANNERWYGA